MKDDIVELKYTLTFMLSFNTKKARFSECTVELRLSKVTGIDRVSENRIFRITENTSVLD